mgnify:FL=1
MAKTRNEDALHCAMIVEVCDGLLLRITLLEHRIKPRFHSRTHFFLYFSCKTVMADNIGENDNSHEENPSTAMGKSQNTESASSQYGSTNYFLQQNTALSQSQEPWTVLWYWLSAQYYQQYCYQLYSYAHYWQTVASQSVYQGALQPQSSYSQPGLNNQGSEAARIGQHPQRNENNEQINHGVGLLQGMAAPWLFPGQQTVTTGDLDLLIVNPSIGVRSNL